MRSNVDYCKSISLSLSVLSRRIIATFSTNRYSTVRVRYVCSVLRLGHISRLQNRNLIYILV